MNAGPTTERVYDALKRRITSGTVRPGEWLDPGKLADELDTSVTPIRDALHRLAGERMVDVRLHEGFHAAALGESQLRDLYAWNGKILGLALGLRKSVTAPEDPASRPGKLAGGAEGGTVAHAAALFTMIAARAGNAELEQAISSANDRLNAPREAEATMFADSDRELGEISVAFAADNMSALRKQLRAYHRRRVATANEIVRILGRSRML